MTSEAVLPALVLCFFRALGFFAAWPVGSGFLGCLNRVLLAAFLTLALSPMPVTCGGLGYLALGLEFVIGFLVALPLALLVSTASMWGELFDTARGQSIGHLYDPWQESAESQMGQLARWFILVYILWIGGAEVLLANFYLSFDAVSMNFCGGKMVVGLGEKLFVAVVALLRGLLAVFMPFAILNLIVELAGGFLSRVLGQVSLIGEAFSIKSMLGLALCWLFWRLEGDFLVQSVLSINYW